jgi:hypothetical protein
MNRSTIVLGRLAGSALALAGLAVLFGALHGVPELPEARAAPAPGPSPEDLLKKAAADGKYAMLLRQIKVEDDQKTYKDFHDLGFRDRRQYGGHNDLPKGWWVYAHPYWYIWRDLAATPKPNRNWGPEQATGEPNTNMAGDIATAWASRSPDDEDEWLLLEYAEPVVPKAVLVHETYNPGALVKVSVFKLDGTEVEAWKGADPTAVGSGIGVSEIPVKVDFKTARVKIYLDSKNVPGWNEIDAVGVRDDKKKTHWAAACEASSTYAAPVQAAPNPAPAGEERLQRLEDEVQKLKATVDELKAIIKKLEKK